MPTIFQHPVELGPVTFNDLPWHPPEAQAWIMDVLEGWKTSPDVRVRSTELGGSRDGEVSASYFPLSSRVLIVGGAVKAATPQNAEILHDLLLREAVPRNQAIKVVRYEDAGAKYVTAKRSGPVETEWPMPDGFRWQTTLMAEDPFKYGLIPEEATAGPAGLSSSSFTFPISFPLVFTGDAGTSDSSAGIFNAGTAPSSHILATITGPLSAGAWRLRNDTAGEEITFDVGLTATDTLIIDFATETALLNGYPISSAVAGTFWKMLPGSNAIRLYADYDPGTTLTVTAESAWE